MLSELRNKILPSAYERMVLDAPEEEKELLPEYNIFLNNLRLLSVSYSTVFRWMRYLGYNYNDNKRSYYTDGHEREDVVRDRNDRFLVSYFKAKLQCYRWVQITDAQGRLFE